VINVYRVVMALIDLWVSLWRDRDIVSVLSVAVWVAFGPQV
jgi:hypothetical protein